MVRRRTLLAATLLAPLGACGAAGVDDEGPAVTSFAELESCFGARLGVYAVDSAGAEQRRTR